MERIAERIGWISLLFSVLFLMHFYSIARLVSLFGANRKLWHYLLMIALSLSLIVATILCRISYNWGTRIIYTFAACWLGVLVILFAAQLFFEIIRIPFNIKGQTAGLAMVGVVAFLTLISLITAQFTRVRTVELSGFGKELNAVLLSDLHVGTIWSENHLQKIVDMANSLNPDVIFITGDSVSGGTFLRSASFAPLRNLNADTFSVNGNHEHYEGVRRMRKVMGENGITTLVDEKIEFNGFEIVGVDYYERDNRVTSILNEMNLSEDMPTIMLSHIPIAPENDKVDLILSGHTHAGQIFPFNFAVRLRYRFIRGLYNVGKTRIYVTPGTNTWGPPMRLGSVNEITLLKLR